MSQVQDLINIEKALKEYYLPVWNNMLTTEPSIMLQKIKKVPLEAQQIVAAAPIGLSGGFGFSAERKPVPIAGAVNFERFKAYAKDMYNTINISIKATKLTGSASSMADALKTEIDAAYASSKWNVARSLFGNGKGILAKVSALATAGNTVTLDSVENVIEGITIDFYATGAAVGSTPAIAARRITAVDRPSKTITIEGAATTIPSGFITLQLSYGAEITGLGAIYDDSIEEIYGVSKTADKFLKPIVEDGSKGIDDTLINGALRRAQREKNSEIDMILCGDDAYDSYVAYLRESNVRVEQNLTPVGNFKAIKFVFGNREVAIANESFVPKGDMWGIETGKIEFHLFDWFFAELQGGGTFNLIPGTSVYGALLASYGELICKNPGGCVRIKDIPSPAA